MIIANDTTKSWNLKGSLASNGVKDNLGIKTLSSILVYDMNLGVCVCIYIYIGFATVDPLLFIYMVLL